MNKIYKSIFNKKLGVWVAVSENTMAQGKPSQFAGWCAFGTGGSLLSLYQQQRDFQP